METDCIEKCIIHLNYLQDEEKRKKKKFKLEMHENQVFKDGEEVSYLMIRMWYLFSY